jgi:hypothetical protein
MRTLPATVVLALLAGACGPVKPPPPAQDPNALTMPKRWILQSYAYRGREHVTKGQGIYLVFRPDNTLGGFDGVNSFGFAPMRGIGGSFVDSEKGGYTATSDGRFHIYGNGFTTLVGVMDPEMQAGIARRAALLGRATAFSCSGDTLVLSDGTPQNQLRYRARYR